MRVISAKYRQFNNWFAVSVTNWVATMECAYLFAILAGYGATAVDWHNAFQIVQWVSQTFLQLVLLAVICVGQKLLGASAEKQAQEMHDAVLGEFSEIREMHRELRSLMTKSSVTS